jgi:hypothetical protein
VGGELEKGEEKGKRGERPVDSALSGECHSTFNLVGKARFSLKIKKSIEY